MTIGFRDTEEDRSLIARLQREGESTTDVLRRALRALDRQTWETRARADMERLRDEDLSDEPDDWTYDEAGNAVSTRPVPQPASAAGPPDVFQPSPAFVLFSTENSEATRFQTTVWLGAMGETIQRLSGLQHLPALQAASAQISEADFAVFEEFARKFPFAAVAKTDLEGDWEATAKSHASTARSEGGEDE